MNFLNDILRRSKHTECLSAFIHINHYRNNHKEHHDVQKNNIVREKEYDYEQKGQDINKILAPSVCHCLLSVHFFIIYVLLFDDFVDIFNNVLVEVFCANLVEFFGEVFMGKVEGPFIAWNKYDVLIILSLLFDDAMHVFIHVSSDKNVNPAILGCFRIFLRFEVIFCDSNVA